MTNNNRQKCDIVVGGQYGSEAKGAISHHLAMTGDYVAMCRGGSSNAGHSMYVGDRKYKNQLVPVGWPNKNLILCMAPAAIFDLPQFFAELKWAKDAGLPVEDRLIVDRNAGIITDHHVQMEVERNLGGKVGSTVHGCGAALAEKVWRDGFKTAKDYPELEAFIGDVSHELNAIMDEGNSVLLEGCQGTMLSLNHGPCYPFATSRDATSSAIANEAGIGARRVRDVYLVVRTYPIRVGGNSGPTGGKELDWATVTQRSGSSQQLLERTTVTNKVRRVFEFNEEDFVKSCELNEPTHIALTFADYLGMENRGIRKYDDLNLDAKNFIRRLEELSDVPVSLVKTGERNEDIVDRRLQLGLVE